MSQPQRPSSCVGTLTTGGARAFRSTETLFQSAWQRQESCPAVHLLIHNHPATILSPFGPNGVTVGIKRLVFVRAHALLMLDETSNNLIRQLLFSGKFLRVESSKPLAFS